MAKEPRNQATPPLFFRDILGQERVLSYLKAALSRGRLAHAYLFLGPEGVGKESVARALAAQAAEVARYRAGEKKLLGVLLGAAMRETKGKADAAVVRKILQDRLG